VARWRSDEDPRVPPWIRHEHDGGFVLADWVTPEDFGLEPRVAEWRAKERWMRARNDWLCDHPDVFAVLLEQLRQIIRDSQ
jgi:hypothetical protein